MEISGSIALGIVMAIVWAGLLLYWLWAASAVAGARRTMDQG